MMQVCYMISIRGPVMTLHLYPIIPRQNWILVELCQHFVRLVKGRDKNCVLCGKPACWICLNNVHYIHSGIGSRQHCVMHFFHFRAVLI